uniref:Uncharacterized protein n=1 Tax=Anguilla anguilla TaxID=7936 RepID=A0A0E9RRC4_ANGAN
MVHWTSMLPTPCMRTDQTSLTQRPRKNFFQREFEKLQSV